MSETLRIDNARLLFRNFAGRKGPFNEEGERSTCVILDQELADQLKNDGWNIKETNVRDEGDVPEFYTQINVNYNTGRPPRVVLISSQGRMDLGPDEVKLIDFADIKTADLIINPYSWNKSGNSGVKGYLKTAFITINEDELERKYADVPEANPMRIVNSIVSEGEMEMANAG